MLELLRWHELRLDILQAEIDGTKLDQVRAVAARTGGDIPAPAQKATGAGGPGRDAPVDAAVAKRPRDRVTALTGYCCSGSWMLGAGRRTHNPLLSWKLMEEMTSFDAAVKRSREGAGVPVRKDFYDAIGQEDVRHVEHLRWNDLLLFGGARPPPRPDALPGGPRRADLRHDPPARLAVPDRRRRGAAPSPPRRQTGAT